MKGEATEAFLNELAITIDSVLRQAKNNITGIDAERAWDMLYSCVKSINGAPVQEYIEQPDAEQKKMNFNYFVQYSDFIVPGIIQEIEEKYGKERLASSISRGDMAASAHEKVLDCAWLYITAKNEQNEEMMFAWAKQLLAAHNNEVLIETMLNDIRT